MMAGKLLILLKVLKGLGKVQNILKLVVKNCSYLKKNVDINLNLFLVFKFCNLFMLF